MNTKLQALSCDKHSIFGNEKALDLNEKKKKKKKKYLRSVVTQALRINLFGSRRKKDVSSFKDDSGTRIVFF